MSVYILGSYEVVSLVEHRGGIGVLISSKAGNMIIPMPLGFKFQELSEAVCRYTLQKGKP